MRKTYPLQIEGKHPDRVLEAVKHDIRKYMKRERRKELPAGADYWDFDCRLGLNPETAESVHPGNLIAQIDALAGQGATALYLEILGKPAQRQARSADQDAAAAQARALAALD